MTKSLAKQSDPLDLCEERGITQRDIRRETLAAEVILLVVQGGLTLEDALDKKDVAPTTWHRWMQEGKINHVLIDVRDQVREGLRLKLFQRADQMLERIIDIGLGELDNANAATQLRALTTMLMDMMGMESPREDVARGLSAEDYLQMTEFEPTTVVVQNIQQQIVGGGNQDEDAPNRTIDDAVEGEFKPLES